MRLVTEAPVVQSGQGHWPFTPKTWVQIPAGAQKQYWCYHMDYDVIVVGGGPAGSSCATFLGRKGIKTLLVDKALFPRDKTCGDGITGKSMKILKDLGITEENFTGQHEILQGIMISASPRTQIKIRDPDPGKGCKRYYFDNMLFQLAKKTADTMENFTVNDVIIENGKVSGIRGTDKTGIEKEFRAKIIVGADGANSIVARKLGLNEFRTDKCYVAIRAYYENVEIDNGFIEMHFMDELLPGYFWIFPVGDNISNVGLGIIADKVTKRKLNLKNMFDRVIKDSYVSYKFKNAKRVSDVRGWNLPTGAQKRKRAGDGFLLVGDAASLIDPFTGEGIGNALASGKLASQTILSALEKNDFSYGILRGYEKAVDAAMEDEFKTNERSLKFTHNKLLFKAFMHEIGKKNEYLAPAFTAFIDSTGKKVKLPLMLYLKIAFRYFVNRTGLKKDL